MPNGLWHVSSTKGKEANDCEGFCRSMNLHSLTPDLVKRWKVFVNDKFTGQPSVSVTAFSSADWKVRKVGLCIVLFKQNNDYIFWGDRYIWRYFIRVMCAGRGKETGATRCRTGDDESHNHGLWCYRIMELGLGLGISDRVCISSTIARPSHHVIYTVRNTYLNVVRTHGFVLMFIYRPWQFGFRVHPEIMQV